MMSLIVGRALEQIFPAHGEALSRAAAPPRRAACRDGLRPRRLLRPVRRARCSASPASSAPGRTEVVRMIFGADRREPARSSSTGTPARSAARATRSAGGRAAARGPAQPGRADAALGRGERHAARRCARFAWARIVLRARLERRAVAEPDRRAPIATPSTRQPLKFLSGGNQQKVLIAKWLTTNARDLHLRRARGRASMSARSARSTRSSPASPSAAPGVIVISSELEEIVGLCQRVIVLREGRLAGELRARRSPRPRSSSAASPPEER